MATKLTKFDAAEYLTEQEDQRELLNDALESGDSRYIAHAVGIIARAKGMTQVQRDTGMKRQALYRSFSKTGNPTLATTMKVLDTLGLKLRLA